MQLSEPPTLKLAGSGACLEKTRATATSITNISGALVVETLLKPCLFVLQVKFWEQSNIRYCIGIL